MGAHVGRFLEHRDAEFLQLAALTALLDLPVVLADLFGEVQRPAQAGDPAAHEKDVHLHDVSGFFHRAALLRVKGIPEIDAPISIQP